MKSQVADAYKRFSGPEVNISSVESGPNYMSLKQSALERYDAEKAVRDKRVLEDRKRAEEERQYRMSIDPQFRAQEKGRKATGEFMDRIADVRVNQMSQMQQDAAEKMNINRTLFNNQGGGTAAQFQKFMNWNEAQSGSPAGKFLISEQIASQRPDVNSAQYKYLQQLANRPTQSRSLF
jgi:hypothetical protein